MNLVEQEIVVRTDMVASRGMPISIGGPLLDHLVRTVRPCVRMALTGRSNKVGHPPEWLRTAWDFQALGFATRGEDTVLSIASPSLGEAAPKFFEQRNLWDEAVQPSETALDLLAKLVGDVRAKASGSNAYDDPLLKQLSGWSSLLQTKVRAIRLPGAVSSAPEIVLDSAVVSAAQELSSRIPTPRQIRLVGTIDMVRWSTRSMAIRLADNTEYRCAVINDELSDLGQYGGREVTVLGKAIYRPSGTVLRLDVQHVLDTTVGRAAHSEVPPSFEMSMGSYRERQTERRGAPAIFGTWPGDETDEELQAALAELRG